MSKPMPEITEAGRAYVHSLKFAEDLKREIDYLSLKTNLAVDTIAELAQTITLQSLVGRKDGPLMTEEETEAFVEQNFDEVMLALKKYTEHSRFLCCPNDGQAQ